jgi:hypothetical protein
LNFIFLNYLKACLTTSDYFYPQQGSENEGRTIKIYYTTHESHLIEKFVQKLKELNGQFSTVGQQRIIRLNAACSKQYVSLRQTRIKADIPADEAYKDPYSEFLFKIF